MQRRRKFYGAIYTSIALLGLLFLLQNKKNITQQPLLTDDVTAAEEPMDALPVPYSSSNQTPNPTPVVEGYKVKVLNELLQAGNDNDTRYDSEFNDLTEAEKDAFRKIYDSLPREQLNRRGTIVFLLGRNIQNRQDLLFFDKVLREARPVSASDDISQIYPQMVALKILKNQPRDTQLRSDILGILKHVRGDQDKRISTLATSIAEELSR